MATVTMGAAGSISAQSVALSVGRSWSSYREFQSPFTVRLQYEFGRAGPITFATSYVGSFDGDRWQRPSCSGFILPSDDCSSDLFRGRFGWHTVSLGVGTTYTFPAVAEIAAHLHGTLSVISGRYRGDRTGGTVGVMPSGITPGWAPEVQLRLAPRRASRFRVVGGFRAGFPAFGHCGEDAYFAFCETHALKTVFGGIALGLK